MMEAYLKAHEYESASPALDAAMTRMHEQNDDTAFREMVCTFVTEACRDSVKLYCPTDRSDINNPLIFKHGEKQLYAFYTDREAALACAKGSMAPERSALYANTGRLPLGMILERAHTRAYLAFNLGLPNEIILPPEILHTICHLMRTHKYHTKEPAGSSWGEWISILERFIADGKDRQALDQNVSMPDTTMRIPVTPPKPGEARLYRLG